MDYVPFEVSQLLYSGIYDSLRRLKDVSESKFWSDYDSYSFLSVGISIDWYLEHCWLSENTLKEMYEELHDSIKDKYFLYDYTKHNRFTLAYDLLGDYMVQRNNIIPRDTFPNKEVTKGFIFVFKGFYVRVVHVFDHSDRNHGSFIAETLSFDEVMNLKKGEN